MMASTKPDVRTGSLRGASSANRRRVGQARVFIAWSEETKAVAEIVCARLDEEKLSPWLNDQIELGAPFRGRIRDAILSADLVVAVFPKEPSRWQIAEAGLAYFEQKLFPVIIETEYENISVIEPFNELQLHKLAKGDVEQGVGGTIDQLVDAVKDRLGEGPTVGWFTRTSRFANKLFLAGVPIAGLALDSALLVTGFESVEARKLELWRAGHTVFGAIVYGGSAFIALVFARAGVSTSFSERQFGFRVAKQLFYLWLIVATAQFFVGLALLDESPFSHKHNWVYVAIVSYLFSVGFWYAGYDRYRSANESDREGKPIKTLTALGFSGNLFFGIGLLLTTLVIVLMSLKPPMVFLFGNSGSS